MSKARKRGTQEWEELNLRTDGYYNKENKKIADVNGELDYYGRQKYVEIISN